MATVRLLHAVKRILKPYIRRFLYLFPVRKHKVVFLNYDGKGFGDSPKCIAEEIQRRKLPWKLVWLVSGDYFVPNSIQRVDLFGFKGFYALSTAKVIINNCKSNLPTYFKKKDNQFYLQTWHGDFALKYIEKEVEDELSIGYLTKTKADSAMTDAVVSGSSFFTNIVRESFWLPEKCAILEYGLPRNDLYFRGESYRVEVRQRYGFSPEDKILLYAPTFRDKGETDCYDLDFNRLRDVLRKKTDTDWRVIVRLHPNVSKLDGLFRYNEWIINGSQLPDQQELCLIADLMITDYSSIMGDFLLMGKPVFLYVPDLERYSHRTTGRGLRDVYYHLPFPFCHDQLELEERLVDFDRTAFSKEVVSFLQTYYHPFDDGHSSERIVDLLTQVMQGDV